MSAAIFLNKLIWLTTYHESKITDGWVFHTQKKLRETTGLSPGAQRTTRRFLKTWRLIEETKAHAHQKLHYRIQWHNWIALLSEPTRYYETVIRKKEAFPDDEGWFYREQKKVRQFTGLSEHSQKKAREQLREAGLIQTKRGGWGNVLKYRICWTEWRKRIANLSHEVKQDLLPHEKPT